MCIRDSSVTLDLAVRRNKDVMLIHTMSIDEDGTTVEVTFQYNKMRGTASGNLIVILLDINGQPLEKQQSCTTVSYTHLLCWWAALAL